MMHMISKARDLKFRDKLTFSTLMVALIPLLIFSMLVGPIIFQEIKMNSVQLTRQMVMQTSESLDIYIGTIEKLMDFVGEGSDGILTDHTGRMKRLEEMTAAILQAYPEIAGITIAYSDDSYLGEGMTRISRDRFADESWYQYAIEKEGQLGIIDATVTCPTGGREAVQYAIDIINRKSGIPKQIILRSHKIRADNVSAYQQEKIQQQQKEGMIHVGYAQIGEDSNWRKASQESIQAAAKEFDIDLTVAFNAKSLEEQKAQVRQFIADDMDVVVISPLVSEGWQDILSEAQEAQIPVLLVDRMVSVEEELYESYIGADFEEEGRRCARWMLRETADREHISIMELRGTEGSSPVQGRKDGFEEVIAGDDRYQIVYSLCGDFSEGDAKRAVREYLMANKWDIDVIYAHNDNMALGAAEVLKEFNIRPGTDVKIVSVDGTAAALEALQKGEVNCVVECNPLLGPQIMKAITDLMQGKELPLRIITDEMVFTKDTPKELFKNRKY